MSVYRRPGQAIYSYDFRHRGRRFSGATGATSRREAIKFEEAEKRKARAAFVEAGKPMTFAAASARYWTEVGRFHVNQGDTLRALDWLDRQIGGRTMIADIGDGKVAELVARRRGDNVAPATVNQSVGFPLRAILIRAAKLWKQATEEIDWKRHILKTAQERVREASADEEAKLMAAIRGDYAPALRFAILTGCRRAEIVGLTWQTVDFFSGRFTVTGKRGRSRTIPMTTATRDLLWGLKDNHPVAVFTYQARRPGHGFARGDHRPITLEGFKTEWRRTLARAGVVGFRFHDTRHTAATRLLRATGNLRLPQRMLGHASLSTTLRYAHVLDEDLRAGMEAMAAGNATPNATETPEGPANALAKKADRK